LLVVLYKLGDAFAGNLTTAFLLRGPGFSATEVGAISKGFGLAATIGGALAGGALSGSVERNRLGLQAVEPIGSGADYAKDAARAKRLEPMVREGHASSLTEMAMRLVISNPKLSTAEIGLADIGELEAALSAVGKGPLSGAALTRLKQLQAGFLGEAR